MGKAMSSAFHDSRPWSQLSSSTHPLLHPEAATTSCLPPVNATTPLRVLAPGLKCSIPLSSLEMLALVGAPLQLTLTHSLELPLQRTP